MTDNYRDEMREALAGLIAGMDAGTFEARCIADDEEELQAKVDATDDLWTNARIALSRLSAQADPALDAREFVRDWIVANHGVLSMAGTAAQDLIVRLQARLSASEQGERSCETCSAPNGAECTRRNCSGSPAFDRWEPAKASGQGEERIRRMVDRFLGWELPDDFCPDCGITYKLIVTANGERIKPIGTNLLTAEQAQRMIEYMLARPAAPASEKGEAKRCAWCGGVFSLTADSYLTCGKCGKQIKPGAYRDPSEIEMHTPADDLYKDAPAQPAPSEEELVRYIQGSGHDSAECRMPSMAECLAALRLRLSEPKE